MKKVFVRVISFLLLLVFGLLGVGCFGCSKKRKERTMYEIVAEYMPDNRSITGTVKVDFYNHTDVEIDCLKFQLYPNAYRQEGIACPIGYDVATEAYFAGSSFGEIDISSVSGCSNFEIGGEDKNILSVFLNKPLAHEDRVVVDIGFSTRLAKVNHDLGVTMRTVNFAGVFPILCAFQDGAFVETLPSDVGKYFFSDCADYRMQLILPKEYMIACPGKIQEERVLESKKRYTMSGTNIRELAFSISKEYQLLEKKTGKTTIFYNHFGESKAEETLKLATCAVECFSSLFGEYPFETLTIAKTEVVRGSAGHGGFIMISPKLSGKELVEALIFEIASAWWYGGVGCNRAESAWLSEGLSAYSVALFFEKFPAWGQGKAEYILACENDYDRYKDSYQKALGWVDLRMNRPTREFLNAYEYDSVVKDKSVVMFSKLEKGIGKKKLLSGLRKYYSENVYAIASPAHLIGAFERCGVNVGGFIESYIEGKGTY